MTSPPSLGKPMLVALSIGCLLCVVAVAKLAGEIAAGMTGDAVIGARVGYAVGCSTLAIAVVLAVKKWRRYANERKS